MDTFEEDRITRSSRSRLHTLMYQAAREGDWQAAKIILEMDPTLIRAKISENGDTALHVAAMSKQTKFVEKLVERMTSKDLLIENNSGYTAFIYAAASGIVKIAAVMSEKTPDLVTYWRESQNKAIYWAALLGYEDMVFYLFLQISLEDLSTQERLALLLATIEKRMYDLALTILRYQPFLATMEDKRGGRQALRLLAEHDITNISTRQEAFWQSLGGTFAAISNISTFQEAFWLTLDRTSAAIPCLSWLQRTCRQTLMRKRAQLLAQEIWYEIQGVEDAALFDKLINNPPILHDAAKVGNVGFITMLTRSYPDLMFRSKSKRFRFTMFHMAVLERQENVFRLFDQIGVQKDFIALRKCDEDGNNILHLAGILAPQNRLKIVAGPALQMQRELMWFKEVEKIVPSLCGRESNNDGFTPRQLFSKHHKDLLKDGETWMKETANYCMVTAALIATMVFAASITVPGGNNGEKGSPILLKRSFFRVFVVTDVAAMFSSTLSIIMFLSILTSRFQEEDFLVLLPAKLIVGLTALFFSIVSAMGAFTSTCFLLFTDQSAWINISVSALLCFILVFIFVILHFRLWIDGIRLTYRCSFLHPSNRENFL